MKNYTDWDYLGRDFYEHMEAIKNAEKEQKSGFFRVKGWVGICTHPDHNFPTHLYIPPGMGYRHICPGCGKIQTVIVNGPVC